MAQGHPGPLPARLSRYIAASPGADRFDLERWREPITETMRGLDLVVALHADPVRDPEMFIEDAAFRLAVDDALREIIDGDAFDLCEGVEILTISGDWDRRADLVMAHIEALQRKRTP